MTPKQQQDKKWDVSKYKPHTHMDVHCRNDNIDAERVLCKHCEGTGNELYSMYRECPKCNGKGYVDD